MCGTPTEKTWPGITKLPDFKLVTIKGLKFDAYMQLIAKSFAVITFGEGFDWFFMQPPQVCSLSFSVFNETFFPNKSWLKLKNVFPSYEEMGQHIIDLIKNVEYNSKDYYDLVKKTINKIDEVYSEKKYLDNLTRFYQKQYDLYPQEKNK